MWKVYNSNGDIANQLLYICWLYYLTMIMYMYVQEILYIHVYACPMKTILLYW